MHRRRRTASNERCCECLGGVLWLCGAGRVCPECHLYPRTGRVPSGAAGGDDRTSSWLFGLQLCITQVLVAPLAWYAGSWIVPLENRAQLRPLAYVAAIAVVCTAEELVLGLGRRLPLAGKLLRIVPAAALNSCVLGTVLVERTQSFTLMQSLGFGLGSGVGYLLAVLLVTEAQHRLRSKAIPSAFRGLPITLVYIGVLALAIYGFTGHSVIL